jgi:hypothetical protein
VRKSRNAGGLVRKPRLMAPRSPIKPPVDLPGRRKSLRPAKKKLVISRLALDRVKSVI